MRDKDTCLFWFLVNNQTFFTTLMTADERKEPTWQPYPQTSDKPENLTEENASLFCSIYND
jgi:hypothetical protein